MQERGPESANRQVERREARVSRWRRKGRRNRPGVPRHVHARRCPQAPERLPALHLAPSSGREAARQGFGRGGVPAEASPRREVTNPGRETRRGNELCCVCVRVDWAV